MQPVRLFNNDQAVYYEHQGDQSAYYESEEYPPEYPVAEEYAAEESQQSEHYWASEDFGQVEYHEEQPQQEEEQPYDY